MVAGEFKKKDKLAKPKPSHKGTVIYRLKPFKNQVRPTPLVTLVGAQPGGLMLQVSHHCCWGGRLQQWHVRRYCTVSCVALAAGIVSHSVDGPRGAPGGWRWRQHFRADLCRGVLNMHVSRADVTPRWLVSCAVGAGGWSGDGALGEGLQGRKWPHP
jgi:hypothetical protein